MTSKEYEVIIEGIKKCEQEIKTSFKNLEIYFLDDFWDNLSKENEEKLQNKFMEEREIGGMPITKDNCEDMFERWSQDLTLSEIYELLK